MTKHRFLIIEDDPFISRTIKNTLEKNDITIVGIAKDLASGIQLLRIKKPDLCLVDIQLKEKFDGILFAKELDKIQLPYFYLTAQTDPITLAKVNNTNPLGYLAKPFTSAGLWSSISVVWNKYLSEKKRIISVKSDGYVYRIPENDILFLEAYDNYCYIHVEPKKILVPQTLKKVRAQLHGNHFFVPHRSYCVNTNKITTIGKKTIYLDAIEISLSEARRPQLLDVINNIN